MPKHEKYLLDTEACILWAIGKLPRKVFRELERADEIFYTEISAWEIMIKRVYIRGNFTYAKFWQFVETIGASAYHMTRRDLDRYSDLPLFPEHSDPFDRMIVAQALGANLTLVGGDEKFPFYRGLKVLWD